MTPLKKYPGYTTVGALKFGFSSHVSSNSHGITYCAIIYIVAACKGGAM